MLLASLWWVERLRRDLNAKALDVKALEEKLLALSLERQLLTSLLDQINQPLWLEDENNNLRFANKAFYRLSATQPQAAHSNDLLDAGTRQALKQEGRPFKDMIRAQIKRHLILRGERRLVNISHIYTTNGTAGFLHDESEKEVLEQNIQQLAQSHAEILDLLPTAIAIFDCAQKLKFSNQAFSVLWGLESPFLDSSPSHPYLLDHLRSTGKISAQPDWRSWKEDLLRPLPKGEHRDAMWTLPDGQILRVVASPHPQGGMTWLYENLTEQINLERRYNILIKIQGESIDHLSEGVAVFGADGLLRLSNPALGRLWQLPPELLIKETHISRLEAHCAPLSHGQEWTIFSAFVTGFRDQRDGKTGRIDLKNGTILDYTLVPLPHGQTMITFVNVSDTVHMARILQEKNEALESADRLRNDFVQHISYQLRTPLTNIIGFTDFLQDGYVGSLHPKQTDYLRLIGSQSYALLDIVNDILDLATVDAGIMELDNQPVSIKDMMNHTSQRFANQLKERNITIVQTKETELETMQGDPARLRQIFTNILNNAIAFAPTDSVIHFTAKHQNEYLIFSIHDCGCGIPQELLDRVFKRFTSCTHHGVRAGTGLGLSIVKSFVELHGGTVTINTSPRIGTEVICIFPLSTRNDSPVTSIQSARQETLRLEQRP
ncbi:ATP-binding protein [Bartonella sp. DGB2]|uniref:sensor histidine kinase n=1 Tax=Bartonella sp. DGB2 TaxID=3388426 RepID=UPI00398FC4F1